MYRWEIGKRNIRKSEKGSQFKKVEPTIDELC
jgi:hypothetical protein